MKYFTCKLIKNVGIGDQLYQLQTLYNLGRSLGLDYVHSPLLPSRWCQNLDLTEFLGLDIGEKTLDDYPSCKMINMDAYQAASYLGDKNKLKNFLASSNGSDIIYRFIFSEKLYQENPCHINIPWNFKFDFREKFIEAQRRLKASKPFSNQLISIAIHIRRGDCTWLEDNGKYFFPYMNKIIEANSKDIDIARAVPHKYYLNLLDEIFKKYDQNLFEINIYSDGIPEQFWIDMNPLQKIKYQLENQGLTSFLYKDKTKIKYDSQIFDERIRQRFYELKNEFDAYKKYANVSLRIGSDVELTKEIITAFATADIAIVAREDCFPEIGLRDFNDHRILMNVTQDQTQNIDLISKLTYS